MEIPGYTVQRIHLRGTEVGARQWRLRIFQFGSKDGRPLVIDRSDAKVAHERACVASEGRRAGKRVSKADAAAQGQ